MDPVVAEKPVLEPLLLPNISASSKPVSVVTSVPCLLCAETFNIQDTNTTYLAHLLKEHKLVIADENLVANFASYVLYWKERFKDQPLTDFCSIIQTTRTEEVGGGYYLLSDVLPEDKQMREFLQKRKLEFVLESQQKERDDCSFSRGCLFCKEHFTGNRSLMFDHMAVDHLFNVGQSDNLVFTNEFLDILEGKLNRLECLFCEKIFRDKIVLKDHMRKKQHRKINCKNQLYDKFYVINYLELGKNWEKLQTEIDSPAMEEDSESEDEWSGWEEEADGQAVCLYCEFASSNHEKLKQHMHELHDFDLAELKRRLNLNFYQQVKLVNYIRRQVHQCVCIGCGEKFEEKVTLSDHMHAAGHTNTLPAISEWDQPQYFFPTYENDNLLCQLEDEDDAVDDSQSNETVIAEDAPVLNTTILSEEGLRRELLTS